MAIAKRRPVKRVTVKRSAARNPSVPSLDDVRAVATAYARVAADLSDEGRIWKILSVFLMGDFGAVESLATPFYDYYRKHYKSIQRDAYVHCVAALAIEGASRAYDEPDAYKARFGALHARNRCESIVQRLDFNVVDLSGPNHAASLAKVNALAAKYVPAATIAAVDI
jgi:hypothetical protein